MSACGTDGLLSKLVDNIRQICEQNITFNDFTSVSGLICFDIDGSRQQCYVISELLQKTSAGEGNSEHLKTLDWKNIDRRKSFVLHSGRKTTVGEALKYEPGKKESTPADATKSTSGTQKNITPLNTKLDWCNRTFTLNTAAESTSDNELPNEPCNNISTTTVILSGRRSTGITRCSSSSPKKQRCQGYFKENRTIVNKFPRRSSPSKPYQRNCYPSITKKPKVKPRRSAYNENIFTKYLKNEERYEIRTPKSYSLAENSEEIRSRYNSPSEKPTALSWFEGMISPGSSVESINSIEPFYLVPQNETLPQPLQAKEDFTPSLTPTQCMFSEKQQQQQWMYTEGQQQQQCMFNEQQQQQQQCMFEHLKPEHRNLGQLNTLDTDNLKNENIFPSNSTSTKSETTENCKDYTESESSPLKRLVPGGTFNMEEASSVSSKFPKSTRESDTISVKRGKHGGTVSDVADHYSLDHPTPSEECSVSRKPGGGLLKWMGLFKKGHKNSTQGLSQPGKKSGPAGKLNKPGQFVLDPPIDIRIKQWN